MSVFPNASLLPILTVNLQEYVHSYIFLPFQGRLGGPDPYLKLWVFTDLSN